MTKLSLNVNAQNPVIDTRVTRSLDAKITLGILIIEFKNGVVKLLCPPYIRELNKQLFVDIERIVHKYFFEMLNTKTLESLAFELKPLASNIVIEV